MSRHGRRAALLALVLPVAGCGGGDDERTIVVSLEGGQGNRNMTACGSQDAFALYRPSDEVEYGGSVNPAPKGRWKAKVKIKKCKGSEYVDTSSQKIVGQPSGAFEGAFQDLAPGAYFLRARYQGGDEPETEKLYFMVNRTP